MAGTSSVHGRPWPREGNPARTLKFLILTSLRSNEVRGARWEEVDLDVATWTVPADRMKRNMEHRVPLSPEAYSVLNAQRGLDADWIFPSTQRGKAGANRPQSENVFKALQEQRSGAALRTGLSQSQFALAGQPVGRHQRYWPLQSAQKRAAPTEPIDLID